MPRHLHIARIIRIARLGLLIAALALPTLGLAGCRNAASPRRVATTAGKAARVAEASGSPAKRLAPINHIVFFKLKNAADAAELIADCDSQLRVLPMVNSYFCGKPLDTGRGDRVDGDFDVGFYVGFASEADYAAYVEHASHEALVAKWQPRWEWIRVHDVQDVGP